MFNHKPLSTIYIFKDWETWENGGNVTKGSQKIKTFRIIESLGFLAGDATKSILLKGEFRPRIEPPMNANKHQSIHNFLFRI
jgi:hypothetical protein